MRSKKSRRFQQTKFVPKNKTKYIGDCKNIVARSSWEEKVFHYIDLNSDVAKWGSEEIAIKYQSPIDRKTHRYFPDLYVETITGKKYIVEIKPRKERLPPKKGKNKKRSTLLYESRQFAINQAKWESAQEFAANNDAEFQIWDEKFLKEHKIL